MTGEASGVPVVVPLAYPSRLRDEFRIEVDGGSTQIRLPVFTGGAPMAVPTDVIVASRALSWSDSDDPLVRLPVIPAVATRAVARTYPLYLSFTEPQRVPPVKRTAGSDIDLSPRATRSEQGVTVDGLCVRVPDIDAALEQLAEAGVVTTDNAAETLGAVLAADPSHHSERPAEMVRRRERWRRGLLAVGGAAFALAVLLRVIGGATGVDLAVVLAALVALLILLAGLRVLLARKVPRSRRGVPTESSPHRIQSSGE